MPRRLRASSGGYAYHVLNRAVVATTHGEEVGSGVNAPPPPAEVAAGHEYMREEIKTPGPCDFSPG